MEKNSKELTGEVVGKLRCVPVNDEALLKANGIHLLPSTLRKNHSIGRNPELFIKIFGRLYVLLDEFEKMISEAKRKRDERITRFNQVPNEKLKAEV